MQVHARPSVAMVRDRPAPWPAGGSASAARPNIARCDSRCAAGPRAGGPATARATPGRPAAAAAASPASRIQSAARPVAGTLRPPPPSQMVSGCGAAGCACSASSRASQRWPGVAAGPSAAATVAIARFDVGQPLREGQVEDPDAEPLRDPRPVARRRRPWSAPGPACAPTTDSRLPSLLRIAPRLPPQQRLLRLLRRGGVTETICSGRGEHQQLFVGAQVERRHPERGDASGRSKADPGIEAPPFGAVAEHVL